MEFHEAANIFPMLTGDEYRALKDDIAQNGQIEPIWTHQGKILDGRNRYVACLELGIEPKCREWTGNSPVAFVVSMNLKRRHLSPSQQAACSIEIEKQIALERKYTDVCAEIIPQTFGETREVVAKLFDINPHYITDAKRIAQEAPDLLDDVRSGELTIPRAMHQLKERKQDELRERPLPIPEGKYSTIVVDPPWPIEKIEREERPNQFAFDYPTMTIEEIKSFVIPQTIALDDSHIFLWTTERYLPSAFEIMTAWGFRYVFTMVWHKPGGFQPYNLPQYNCEFVLYGRRGSPQFTETKNFFTCFDAPRNGHSVKPEDFYKTIARVCPSPRIEIFSRNNLVGFETWGNEKKNE